MNSRVFPDREMPPRPTADSPLFLDDEKINKTNNKKRKINVFESDNEKEEEEEDFYDEENDDEEDFEFADEETNLKLINAVAEHDNIEYDIKNKKINYIFLVNPKTKKFRGSYSFDDKMVVRPISEYERQKLIREAKTEKERVLTKIIEHARRDKKNSLELTEY